MEGELGAVNGMVDDSDVQVGNENIGGIMGEEAAEGAAGLNASSDDGVDGEEPTGEVRQERVVVSENADRMIIVALAASSRIPGTLDACILIDGQNLIFLPLQVKFLIPNAAAGSIIGKGGAHISEIQTQSGARMQVFVVNNF